MQIYYNESYIFATNDLLLYDLVIDKFSQQKNFL